jgi:hypothetical protein
MRSNGAAPFSFLTSRRTYRKPWKLAGASGLTSGLCRRRDLVRFDLRSEGYRARVVAAETATVAASSTATFPLAVRVVAGVEGFLGKRDSA